MAIQAEAVELRQRAQFILTEIGKPLPGELHVMEEFGARLTELHQAELSVKNEEWARQPALKHLFDWLLHPGIVEGVLKHRPQNADPSEIFHAGLYNEVLNYARSLPLREIEVSGSSSRYGLRVWSAHWNVEEQISLAAKAAVLGDLLPLPTLAMDDCSVRFSERRNYIWDVSPDGNIVLKAGKRDPRFANTTSSIRKIRTMVNHLENHFVNQQPKGQDWY